MTNRTIRHLLLISFILLVLSVAGAAADSKQYIARGVSTTSEYVQQAFSDLGWGTPPKQFLREVSRLYGGQGRCTSRDGRAVCVDGKGKQGKRAFKYDVYIK